MGGAPSRRSQLLSVSAAARLLGVSSSSLRAWAAAGRVPHVRTPGGHRRFELDELVRWLAERGGAPPAPAQRSAELVPTRMEPVPALAEALREQADAVVDAFEEELAQTRGAGAGRASAGRRARVTGALDSLAAALDAGDLGECYAEAEWEGFRHGASGQPGDVVVTEALAVRRAVDRVLARGRQRPPARPARTGARARPDGGAGGGRLRRRRPLPAAVGRRLRRAGR